MEGAQQVGELVRRARDGDQGAWDGLVEEFSPMIWNVVRSYRLSAADAADAHAMTWVRMIDNVGRIREPDRVAGWLKRTASNEALSLIRKSRRIDYVEPNQFDQRQIDTPDVDHGLLVDEDANLVRQTLRTLDQKCQQLLRLLYGEPRFSYDEVAGILGRPIGSIGPTRQRCLEKMRAGMASAGAKEAPDHDG